MVASNKIGFSSNLVAPTQHLYLILFHSLFFPFDEFNLPCKAFAAPLLDSIPRNTPVPPPARLSIQRRQQRHWSDFEESRLGLYMGNVLDAGYIGSTLETINPVYPRLSEVRMLDFHALMPSDGSYTELKFVELLDSVIAMAKTTFDRVSMLAHQTGNLSQVGSSLVAELVDIQIGNLSVSELESNKYVHEDIQTVQSLDGDNAG
ncbi:hypothetical protein AAZX31_16G079200 [Glycine max]